MISQSSPLQAVAYYSLFTLTLNVPSSPPSFPTPPISTNTKTSSNTCISGTAHTQHTRASTNYLLCLPLTDIFTPGKSCRSAVMPAALAPDAAGVVVVAVAVLAADDALTSGGGVPAAAVLLVGTAGVSGGGRLAAAGAEDATVAAAGGGEEPPKLVSPSELGMALKSESTFMCCWCC